MKVDFVFDGPPGPLSGRFVEVETTDGASVGVGKWIDRGNGMWALRVELKDDTDIEPERCEHGYRSIATCVPCSRSVFCG